MFRKIGLTAVLLTVAGVASAKPENCTTKWFFGFPVEECTPVIKHITKAPEIDPASAMADLTLMIGALAVLRGRRTKTTKA